MITVTLQPDPRWTTDFIDHVERHGHDAYGSIPPQHQRDAERKRIETGEPSTRHRKPVACFEIHVDNRLAGEVIVASQAGRDGTFEMTISVFDQFTGRGVAKEAIRQFLKANTLWPVSAVVKSTNPNLSKISHILESLGFENIGGSPDTGFMLDRGS